MLDRLTAHGFEMRAEPHAAAILEKDFPVALQEIEQVLSGLRIPITEIIGSGGGEAKGTPRMRHAFNDAGWRKAIFEIRKIINGLEREAISHEVDHAKEFDGHKLALEINWIAADLFVLSPQQVAVELRGNDRRRVLTRVTSWSRKR
jgi:hypothetical protein